MAIPKTQTLQQKLGFSDEDIKKPKHDEIMLWLDKNIEEIVNKMFNLPYTSEEINSIRKKEVWKIDSIIRHFESQICYFTNQLNQTEEEKRKLPYSLRYTDDELTEIIEKITKKKEKLLSFNIESEIPQKPRITKISKKWEYPVTTGNVGNKYTIGFIDFVASFRIPVLELSGLIEHKKERSLEIEYYDFDEKKLKFEYKPKDETMYVEVKTDIKSLGELIRQINHYKTYINGNYYVLCPDDSHKETLLRQGIYFIDYR